MTYRYRTTLRPASGGGVPLGVRWEYVEAPAMTALCIRHDLPLSRHRYGVIATDRALTAEELDHFDIVEAS